MLCAKLRMRVRDGDFTFHKIFHVIRILFKHTKLANFVFFATLTSKVMLNITNACNAQHIFINLHVFRIDNEQMFEWAKIFICVMICMSKTTFASSVMTRGVRLVNGMHSVTFVTKYILKIIKHVLRLLVSGVAVWRDVDVSCT